MATKQQLCAGSNWYQAADVNLSGANMSTYFAANPAPSTGVPAQDNWAHAMNRAQIICTNYQQPKPASGWGSNIPGFGFARVSHVAVPNGGNNYSPASGMIFNCEICGFVTAVTPNVAK